MTGSVSGCARAIHGGGEAVIVARQTAMPFSASRSMTRSNHAHAYRPGAGSTMAQEKMPSVTRFTPASRISAMSSAHTCGDHCSGL